MFIIVESKGLSLEINGGVTPCRDGDLPRLEPLKNYSKNGKYQVVWKYINKKITVVLYTMVSPTSLSYQKVETRTISYIDMVDSPTNLKTLAKLSEKGKKMPCGPVTTGTAKSIPTSEISSIEAPILTVMNPSIRKDGDNEVVAEMEGPETEVCKADTPKALRPDCLQFKKI